MLEELLKFLEDKKILILGFGMEGQASYSFMRRHFKDKKIYIADQVVIDENLNDNTKNAYKDEKNGLVEFNFGNKYLDNLENYDLILKTPGLSFKDVNIKKIKNKIYTSIDLFLKYYNIVTVGVTGTKGKSTTSSLIYHALKSDGKDVYLLGNIGIPLFDEIEKIKEDSYAVIELSSHQLQFMEYTTSIAILINVYQEHLDHYESYDEYRDCKYNIFTNVKNMKKINPDFKQIQIYGKETDAMIEKNFEYNDEAICVDLEDESYKPFLKNLNLSLKGRHNLQNTMFALIVADLLNLNMQKAIEGVENFTGLYHRLEYITEYNGVKYFNDSISTIPEATIVAIETYKDTETLVLGGLDRGLDYTGLINFLNKIYDDSEYKLKNILLLPDTGHLIEDRIRVDYNKIKVKDVVEAVEKSVKITKSGSCILSPGAASYGFYKNFQERGNMFREAILDFKEGGKDE